MEQVASHPHIHEFLHLMFNPHDKKCNILQMFDRFNNQVNILGITILRQGSNEVGLCIQVDIIPKI